MLYLHIIIKTKNYSIIIHNEKGKQNTRGHTQNKFQKKNEKRNYSSFVTHFL